MAYPFGGNWLTVGQLIDLFTAMGCTLNEPDAFLTGPDGTFPIRFLYSDITDDFVSLNSYTDDERIGDCIFDKPDRFISFSARSRWQQEIFMATGKKPASIASKELSSKKSSKSEKTVAGSDLAQAKKNKPKGKK